MIKKISIFIISALLISSTISKKHSFFNMFKDDPPQKCQTENCISCDQEGIECYKCIDKFFVTLDNHCKQCAEGCNVCYKKEICVDCERFWAPKKDDGNVCEKDFKQRFPYIVFWGLLGVIVVMSCCWLKLKCRNRRKMKTLKEKAQEIKASPLLTPMSGSLKNDDERPEREFPMDGGLI